MYMDVNVKISNRKRISCAVWNSLVSEPLVIEMVSRIDCILNMEFYTERDIM